MSEIDREAWLRAVGEAEVIQNDPNALTIADLAQVFQCERSAAEHRVKKLVAIKKARVVRVKRQDPSGKWRIYNGYVLVKEPTHARRRARH